MENNKRKYNTVILIPLTIKSCFKCRPNVSVESRWESCFNLGAMIMENSIKSPNKIMPYDVLTL